MPPEIAVDSNFFNLLLLEAASRKRLHISFESSLHDSQKTKKCYEMCCMLRDWYFNDQTLIGDLASEQAQNKMFNPFCINISNQKQNTIELKELY